MTLRVKPENRMKKIKHKALAVAAAMLLACSPSWADKQAITIDEMEGYMSHPGPLH